MTREQKLSAISMKIARTGGGTGVGETGYFLPIFPKDFATLLTMEQAYILANLWEDAKSPIDSQSDECVDYVYSLIS